MPEKLLFKGTILFDIKQGKSQDVLNTTYERSEDNHKRFKRVQIFF